MAWAFFCGLLLWCASPALQAAPRDVYVGTLGAAPARAVVLELEVQPGARGADAAGAWVGRYFDRQQGVDIPLRGTSQALAEGLPLKSLAPQGEADAHRAAGPVFADAQQRTITWHGLRGQGVFSGEWVDGIHERRMPFSLRWVARYDPQSWQVQQLPFAYPLNPVADEVLPEGLAITPQATPYEHLRLDVPMVPGDVVRVGPQLAWQRVRDPRTGVAYPRITEHPHPARMAAANALLVQRHWRMNQDALACKAAAYTADVPAAGTVADYDLEQVDVAYLSAVAMSVVESGAPECGGAHANHHYNPFTLDLLRGGYLDFARLLRGYAEAEGQPPYSPALGAVLQQAWADAQESEGEAGACGSPVPDAMRLHWSGAGQLAWVAAGMGRSASACLGAGASLSWQELAPFWTPEAADYLPVRTP